MNLNVKLLDEDNNLSEDFNKTVELVLKGVHGEKYFDIDEELQDTRAIKVIKEDKPTKSKTKITYKDFIPVIFFIVITIIICVGGYLFIDKFDLTSLLGK